MKKLLVKLSALVATFVAVFSLTACGGDEKSIEPIEKAIENVFPDSKILKNQEEEAIKAGIKNPKECLNFISNDKEFEYKYVFIETKAGEKIVVEGVRSVKYDSKKWTVDARTIPEVFKLREKLECVE